MVARSRSATSTPANNRGNTILVGLGGGLFGRASNVRIDGGTVSNTTTIAISADGGTAVSSANGGNGNAAAGGAGGIIGNGGDAAAGNGGIAVAEANGGTVTVGDINSGGNIGNTIVVEGIQGGNVAVDGGTVTNETTIDISADGGTAVSSADGGDGNAPAARWDARRRCGGRQRRHRCLGSQRWHGHGWRCQLRRQPGQHHHRRELSDQTRPGGQRPPGPQIHEQREGASQLARSLSLRPSQDGGEVQCRSPASLMNSLSESRSFFVGHGACFECNERRTVRQLTHAPRAAHWNLDG